MSINPYWVNACSIDKRPINLFHSTKLVQPDIVRKRVIGNHKSTACINLRHNIDLII